MTMGEAALALDAGEGAAKLRAEHGGGVVGFALGEDFSDADDGNDAMLEGSVEFLINDMVGFVEVLATFGVTDEGMGCADGFEHVRGGFAGEGAFLGVVHILQASEDV